MRLMKVSQCSTQPGLTSIEEVKLNQIPLSKEGAWSGWSEVEGSWRKKVKFA